MSETFPTLLAARAISESFEKPTNESTGMVHHLSLIKSSIEDGDKFCYVNVDNYDNACALVDFLNAKDYKCNVCTISSFECVNTYKVFVYWIYDQDGGQFCDTCNEQHGEGTELNSCSVCYTTTCGSLSYRDNYCSRACFENRS